MEGISPRTVVEAIRRVGLPAEVHPDREDPAIVISSGCRLKFIAILSNPLGRGLFKNVEFKAIFCGEACLSNALVSDWNDGPSGLHARLDEDKDAILCMTLGEGLGYQELDTGVSRWKRELEEFAHSLEACRRRREAAPTGRGA